MCRGEGFPGALKCVWKSTLLLHYVYLKVEMRNCSSGLNSSVGCSLWSTEWDGTQKKRIKLVLIPDEMATPCVYFAGTRWTVRLNTLPHYFTLSSFSLTLADNHPRCLKLSLPERSFFNWENFSWLCYSILGNSFVLTSTVLYWLLRAHIMVVVSRSAGPMYTSHCGVLYTLQNYFLNNSIIYKFNDDK